MSGEPDRSGEEVTGVDVYDTLDQLVAVVENARAMPMSASCLVNRGEVLGLLDELRRALPVQLSQAEELLAEREQVLADTRREAAALLEQARAERDRLVSDTEVYQAARARAEAELAEARAEIERTRAEVDDYIDTRLATFEVALTKTMAAVRRGRQRLAGEDPTPLAGLDSGLDAQ